MWKYKLSESSKWEDLQAEMYIEGITIKNGLLECQNVRSYKCRGKFGRVIKSKDAQKHTN